MWKMFQRIKWLLAIVVNYWETSFLKFWTSYLIVLKTQHCLVIKGYQSLVMQQEHYNQCHYKTRANRSLANTRIPVFTGFLTSYQIFWWKFSSDISSEFVETRLHLHHHLHRLSIKGRLEGSWLKLIHFFGSNNGERKKIGSFPEK